MRSFAVTVRPSAATVQVAVVGAGVPGEPAHVVPQNVLVVGVTQGGQRGDQAGAAPEQAGLAQQDHAAAAAYPVDHRGQCRVVAVPQVARGHHGDAAAAGVEVEQVSTALDELEGAVGQVFAAGGVAVQRLPGPVEEMWVAGLLVPVQEEQRRAGGAAQQPALGRRPQRPVPVQQPGEGGGGAAGAGP
ncbi:hypothetical protein [Actinoplanes philippinensis]|uniref:hypothetical protein n=1 Tax=Actinoplanes philippinensis TaxID=35752 RepID=UPI0033D092D9